MLKKYKEKRELKNKKLFGKVAAVLVPAIAIGGIYTSLNSNNVRADVTQNECKEVYEIVNENNNSSKKILKIVKGGAIIIFASLDVLLSAAILTPETELANFGHEIENNILGLFEDKPKKTKKLKL